MVVIVLAVGGCSGGDGNTVTMESGRRFEPGRLTISAGETVSFTSESDDAHSVTVYEDGLPEGASYFASGGFESEGEARDDVAGGLLSPGESFEVKFDVPGTYRYFCIAHEDLGMIGRIVVEERPSGATGRSGDRTKAEQGKRRIGQSPHSDGLVVKLQSAGHAGGSLRTFHLAGR